MRLRSPSRLNSVVSSFAIVAEAVRLRMPSIRRNAPELRPKSHDFGYEFIEAGAR